MGKTRGLLKKIRDTKGTFHAKMGSVKDRNGMARRFSSDPHPPNEFVPSPFNISSTALFLFLSLN